MDLKKNIIDDLQRVIYLSMENFEKISFGNGIVMGWSWEGDGTVIRWS